MSGKQMEGDNQRRRTLARQARQRGRRPSEVGATFGADRQLTSLDRSRRDGPPPAGARKPSTERGGPTTAPPAPAERPMPAPDELVGTTTAEVPVIAYRDLVSDIGRRAGVDFEQARAAAGATVAALARALDTADRQRLLDAVPNQLHDDGAMAAGDRRRDLAGFLDEVARSTHRSPEQARYQAQATLSALAAQDGGLIDSLHLPPELRELLGPPPAGGGLVDPAGATAALTDDELRDALATLPYWSGDRRGLTRTIELPPENLDRVLGRLARLRPETGRGPTIGRESPQSAVLTVRTRSLDAVTALDVTLAHQIDDAIDEVGAGMAAPPERAPGPRFGP
ncbi:MULTISPECIES: DUF2267 domain-containing protein [unclassified Plantactinospora]|uniref:DUF2267 domain-containing protein n=1 Tax=unclassified Plantactinospora TaxID=2631981 RepID=UPI000D159829|nr:MULTISPECIES: DUF2267 domain-containing protein [unclassified Plantactinospora]AVT28532.1 hypothetical protein C6361_02370 [Plantactinospora sp. BC1]AVT38232.1 hypothetical protein C6W10_19300 [Plantactinospora sp. BB1]